MLHSYGYINVQLLSNDAENSQNDGYKKLTVVANFHQHSSSDDGFDAPHNKIKILYYMYHLHAVFTLFGRNKIPYIYTMWFNNVVYPIILPNREKIISRSSSVVTGFSLQTNSTLSGGAASASGKSPTCKHAKIININQWASHQPAHMQK